jgi:hypothetical protein
MTITQKLAEILSDVDRPGDFFTLMRWQETQDPHSGSTDPGSAGNGSLMRLAPVAIGRVLRIRRKHNQAFYRSGRSGGLLTAIGGQKGYRRVALRFLVSHPLACATSRLTLVGHVLPPILGT